MAIQTIISENPPAKESLETFAERLLNKIVHAPARRPVRRYIMAALGALYKRKVNGYIIQRFIDRVILYMNNLSPSDPREVDNTRTAKKRLKKFRQRIGASGDININKTPATPSADEFLSE